MAATTSDAGTTRRDFLYVASVAVGGVGVAVAAWPFIDQMNPSTAALALEGFIWSMKEIGRAHV